MPYFLVKITIITHFTKEKFRPKKLKKQELEFAEGIQRIKKISGKNLHKYSVRAQKKLTLVDTDG